MTGVVIGWMVMDTWGTRGWRDFAFFLLRGVWYTLAGENGVSVEGCVVVMVVVMGEAVVRDLMWSSELCVDT